MPESAWKFLFYLGAWSYSAYLLFGTDYPFFHDPPSVFYGRGPARHSREVCSRKPALWWGCRDFSIPVLTTQAGYQGHTQTCFLPRDAWSCLWLFLLNYAVITCLQVSCCFACVLIGHLLYHNVGILVLFLHDVSDVQLEFTKLNVYFKSRGGSHHRLHALAADLGCLSFSLSWFWFRLYWFPLKVLYATCHSSLRSVPDIPFYFFFNALLLLLTLMN
ncbi:hypothetical protein PANDA_000567, partial [Ailuropoda melanoleuca]